MQFRHILCAFQQPNEHLLEPIYRFGGRHGWLIEQSNDAVPREWDGDGVITDYLTLEELGTIRRIREIPVVSRILPPGGNVRTVLSDTRAVAHLALDFLEGQGFRIFASVSKQEFPGSICGTPITPGSALRELAAERGLEFYPHNCYPVGTKNGSYPEMLTSLSEFFRQLPKPAALILTSYYMAVPTCRVLAELGVRIPEEIAILCNTDNLLYTDCTPIALSHISGEHGTVGLKLAETMQRMLEGKEVPLEPVLVGPSAIARRASTDVIAVPHLKLATAIRFLIQNYAVPVGIGEAARYAGLSQSMLNRLFRRHLGKTGAEFLQELRLNRIRNLLASSDSSLSKIAAETGYSSAVSLSLAFRRATGMQPGAFRAARRQNK